MAKVAKAEGLPVPFGQSPFAISRGVQFEKELFENDAERLTTELIGKEVLPPGAGGFIDLRIRKNGGTNLDFLDDAIEQTRNLIGRIASAPRRNRSSLPAIAAAPTLRIPKGILLPEAILIIDTLAVRLDGEKPELIVGEIKSYPDRGGHTAAHELASARAQAGVYVHALELAVSELGHHHIAVSKKGFLVLTRPGSNQPSIRVNEDLRYQAERAKRGFALLERAAGALSPDLWADDDSDLSTALVKAVSRAETDYNEICVSFCSLAPRCFKEARVRANPVILGAEVRRFLGEVDLNRVQELLDGAEPRSEAEVDLFRRIQETEGLLGT